MGYFAAKTTELFAPLAISRLKISSDGKILQDND